MVVNAQGQGPGFFPKAAVVASRAIYYPFALPQKVNEAATLTGSTLNHMVGGVNASIGNALMALKPRGPAAWLMPLFAKVDTAVQESDRIAKRNKDVFWDPATAGIESVGRAIASPGAYWYLRKSGVEQPSQDLIKGVLQQGLFDFGAPAGAAPAPAEAPPADPAAAEAPPADPAGGAATQAAESAGQVAA